ncbi:MAG: nucleotidyltransferase family protein [Gammaproteobacteria bacterium]
MKALILAAGRGTRLRPLTDLMPKPLLVLGEETLLARQIRALAQAGICELVINLSYRGDMIRKTIGSGERYGVRIHYSDEGATPLETAGGIRRALAFLRPGPFWVVNADLVTDFPYATLALHADEAARIVLVPNPPHHPEGDFALDEDRVRDFGMPRFTFAGIGIYAAHLFEKMPPDVPIPLAPCLKQWAEAGILGGAVYPGLWRDVGTPESWRIACEQFATPKSPKGSG